MEREAIRAEVIRCLAELQRVAPEELEGRLREFGDGMPIDSHRMVRCVPKLAKALGIKVKYSKKLAWAFQSVDALTTFLYGEKKKVDDAVA
jgi:acyl carrier protein